MSVNPACRVASGLDADSERMVIEVIEKYRNKTPSELELLTTTHYVFQKINPKDIQSVIGGVVKIKGSKYGKDQIEKAMKELGLYESHVM